MKIKIIFLTLLILTLYSCEWTSKQDKNLSEFDTGQGIVEYTSYAPLKDKPIFLHFYIPEGDMTTMPIIFILPGTGRNANDYLNGWLKYYKDKKAIVISMEFPADHYSTSEYIEGNMFKNNQIQDETNWSYSVIEPIFEFIKTETGNKTTKYNMFGHSAGAQFVHRFVTFKKDINLDKAIAANSGWYTVPDINIGYPYGLKNSGFESNNTLTNIFRANMTIALGESDTDPNDSSLRHTAEADAQGLYRFARGEYYFQQSQAIANSNNTTFTWKKITVPNVAHDFEGMMQAVGGEFF